MKLFSRIVTCIVVSQVFGVWFAYAGGAPLGTPAALPVLSGCAVFGAFYGIGFIIRDCNR